MGKRNKNFQNATVPKFLSEVPNEDFDGEFSGLLNIDKEIADDLDDGVVPIVDFDESENEPETESIDCADVDEVDDEDVLTSDDDDSAFSLFNMKNTAREAYENIKTNADPFDEMFDDEDDD